MVASAFNRNLQAGRSHLLHISFSGNNPVATCSVCTVFTGMQPGGKATIHEGFHRMWDYHRRVAVSAPKNLWDYARQNPSQQ